MSAKSPTTSDRSGPELVNLYKYKGEGKPAKLSFALLQKHSPDLANRIELLLDRIKQWEAHFGDDANWANRWFNGTTISAIGIGLLSIGLAAYFSLQVAKGNSGLSALLVVFGSLAAVVGAVGQSYGWHKRYKAMFGARWEMTALRLAIEQQAINIAMSHGAGMKLSAEQLKDLNSLTLDWTKEASRILSAFGHEYGSSLQPIQLPTSK